MHIKKFIIDKLRLLFDEFSNEDSQNIQRELSRVALHDTAIFVQKNMSNVKMLYSTNDLLKESLECVSIKKGLYLEFGVYRGGSINFIAKNIGKNKIYGFDSFDGLPETWRSNFEKGIFKIDSLPKVENNVVLVKGWFKDTLPKFISHNPKSIAFLHIDSDLYSSAKTIFDNVSPYINKGTIIVFDEFFNYPGWEENEYKAFMEFIEKSKKKFEYIGYNAHHEQVAVEILG